MRSPSAALLALFCSGCASWTPHEHGAAVQALPGRKPLRVGLVVLGNDRALPPALTEPAAAPGGAAPRPAVGVVYREAALPPAALRAEDLVAAVVELGAFTDVVPLPFDGRGVASREALVQRVQDRVWPLALAQEVDALLVVEGVRDGGLAWSDADEGLLTFDTVLWWLAWPLGLWFTDRDYTPDVSLVASTLWVGDPRPVPVPADASVTPGTLSLQPWQRANVPLLGLVLPPAWLGDDRQAVATAVGAWSREMLPIELVRRLKRDPLPGPAGVQIAASLRGDRIVVAVDSPTEVTALGIVGLPRGVLASPAVPAAVEFVDQLALAAGTARHVATGSIDLAALSLSGVALLRVRATLADGAQVSRTWSFAELEAARP
jgi:hypothetical protein